MSIPNSDNAAPVPVTTAPDWAEGITTTFIHGTLIFASRSGKEQRTRQRSTPKARINWTVSGLTVAEALSAMTAAEVEARRLCVVPFWTEAAKTIDSTADDVVTISVDTRPDFFAPGHFVYLDDGAQRYFREILSVNERILTLVADGAAPIFSAGAWAYPCRKCRRVPVDETLTRNDFVSHKLMLQYETVE